MSILSLTTRKRKRNPQRKRKIVPSYLSWIKQHVSEIDLGLEVEDAKGIHPVHLNTNQEILAHFGNLRQSIRSWLEDHWDWAKLKDHCFFRRHLLFRWRCRTPETPIPVFT